MPSGQVLGMRRVDPARELPGYAWAAMARAIDVSGYPLLVEERDAMEFDSQIQLATPEDPVHTLTVSGPYRDHLTHFALGAAYKIIRFFEQPAEERYLPASETRSGLPERERRALRELEPWSRLPRADFENMAEFLYRGTVRQLTSYPVDLRVEHEIAEQLPEHGERQRAYLERQVRDFEPTFDPEMAAALPERISRASQGMNVAFAEEAAELTKTRSGRMCREAQYRAVGERLREELHDMKGFGARGDRLLTDRWAEKLGLRHWYEWRRMEEAL